MADAIIPVDLRNPGQVFACLGLMEAAEILIGPAEGAYHWSGRETRVTFRLSVDGPADPVLEVLRFLSKAEVKALVPPASTLDTDKWNLQTVHMADLPPLLQQENNAFSCPMPKSTDICPVVLEGVGNKAILISHWADASHRDTMKFWGGSGGMPGATITERTLKLVAELGDNALAEAARDPFALSAPQSSSFRFDWRRDYTALDVGFSPNEHKKSIRMVGYPLVELLAAIGLEHARPQRPDPRDKLSYRYAVSNARLPTMLARAVLGGRPVDGRIMGLPVRHFAMRLGWPGQEGQARCILDAQEESFR